MSVRVLHGDCREILPTLPDESVNCCVTSPPYWGLRDYGCDGQIGLEPTPEAYVAELVAVFREVRRVLRGDGTLWLNLGDSYSGSGPSGASYQSKTTIEREGKSHAGAFAISKTLAARGLTYAEKKPIPAPGTKPKDLVGIPWRVAFALQADGWYLRSDIIWAKPNPMPESVRDRPTKAHEYVFMLSKSARYWYDAGTIAEPLADANAQRTTERYDTSHRGPRDGGNSGMDKLAARMRAGEHANRNARTVWTIATQPFSGAHFATMPPALAERCIKAGCPEGGTVLDPFGGAGTTGLVADRLGRNAVLIELNPTYGDMAQRRIVDDAPLFAQDGAA